MDQQQIETLKVRNNQVHQTDFLQLLVLVPVLERMPMGSGQLQYLGHCHWMVAVLVYYSVLAEEWHLLLHPSLVVAHSQILVEAH